MFFKVFHFWANSLAVCFPSALEALKVIQVSFKILPGASQEGPKDAQESPKRLPRGAQDGPRRCHGRPWSDRDWEIRRLQNGMDKIEKNNFESLHPKAPKRSPRDFPEVPRGPQDDPKMPPGGSQGVSQSPPMWPALGPGAPNPPATQLQQTPSDRAEPLSVLTALPMTPRFLHRPQS